MSESRNGRAASGGGGQASFGTALTIEEIHGDAQLGPEEFEAKYGNGFLLVTAAGLESQKGTTTQLLLDGVDEDPAAHTAGLAVVVYPLRQRDILGGHLVTIGREQTHDIVIPDPSVSRFHAFAKQGEDGGFLLQDAGSTNGTTVNGDLRAGPWRGSAHAPQAGRLREARPAGVHVHRRAGAARVRAPGRRLIPHRIGRVSR